MKKYYKSVINNEVLSEKEYLEKIENEAQNLYKEHLQECEDYEDIPQSYEEFKLSLFEQESDYILVDEEIITEW